MTLIGPSSRRDFLKTSTICLAGGLFTAEMAKQAFADAPFKAKLSAHMWVYASKYPPDWDATADLEKVFSDLHQAGFDGLETMDVILRHDDSVEHLKKLVKQYKLPVSGASYQGPMWDAAKHDEILSDATIILKRLGQLDGKTFGISVGDARRLKTESELDAQAKLLREIQAVCADNGVVANLHNHTYEVRDDMHDLKGTLARIPDIKLGPDLNWLIRGGVDPVSFIKTYGHQMVYMHIRDQYKDGTWTEYVGEGVTDFPAIAAALRSVDFRGRAAVELAFPKDFVPKNPLAEDWKRSREYVKKTFDW
jgi:sugar phosphate isomerase/epimerase